MVDAEKEFDAVPASQAWIDADIERITREVSFVGDASRWYDYVYRFGVWLDSGRRRRLWTAGGRRRIDWVINSCTAYNQLQRERRRSRHDPTRNLVVPSDERVHQVGVWVTEFFPPSRYERLIKDLKSNGWDYEAERWSWGPATESVKRGASSGRRENSDRHGLPPWVAPRRFTANETST